MVKSDTGTKSWRKSVVHLISNISSKEITSNAMVMYPLLFLSEREKITQGFESQWVHKKCNFVHSDETFGYFGI